MDKARSFLSIPLPLVSSDYFSIALDVRGSLGSEMSTAEALNFGVIIALQLLILFRLHRKKDKK